MVVQTKANILSLLREYQSQLKNLGVRREGLFGSFVHEQQNRDSMV